MDIPLDAENKDQLSLSRDIVGTFLLAQAGKADLLALYIAVLFDIGFGALEDDAALLLVGLERKSSQRMFLCRLSSSSTESAADSDPKDG